MGTLWPKSYPNNWIKFYIRGQNHTYLKKYFIFLFVPVVKCQWKCWTRSPTVLSAAANTDASQYFSLILFKYRLSCWKKRNVGNQMIFGFYLKLCLSFVSYKSSKFVASKIKVMASCIHSYIMYHPLTSMATRNCSKSFFLVSHIHCWWHSDWWIYS